MEVIHECIDITTKNRIELINITIQIISLIHDHDITNGIVNISTEHTTSAIIINEDEENLKMDIKNYLEKVVPKDNYHHDRIDNNASSHLRALLLSPSETLPIIDGYLNLGTWQSIFFIELDGPRAIRNVNITIIGE